jgi:hypothetical protein
MNTAISTLVQLLLRLSTITVAKTYMQRLLQLTCMVNQNSLMLEMEQSTLVFLMLQSHLQKILQYVQAQLMA